MFFAVEFYMKKIIVDKNHPMFKWIEILSKI
jgi:hypothetical protein